MGETALKFAAFADEIGPELEKQIRICRENGVTHFELRGVAGKNVLDFDKELRAEVRSRLRDNGMGVACIGSPIGKVKIDEPWEAHFERFKIAVELAEFFEAPLIRIFSYYPPAGGNILKYRDEVLRRMRAKVSHIGQRNVTLVHENEKEIYGEKGKECVDLMQSVDSPKFRSAFDFANFVQIGEKPLDNWPALKPYSVHIHIKDAQMGTGKVVPAGEGDGQIEPILADAYRSGYRGFLSLEPHLKSAGKMGGDTGEELFKVAADALKKQCAKLGIPLSHAI